MHGNLMCLLSQRWAKKTTRVRMYQYSHIFLRICLPMVFLKYALIISRYMASKCGRIVK
jgi:hypothetical protein